MRNKTRHSRGKNSPRDSRNTAWLRQYWRPALLVLLALAATLAWWQWPDGNEKVLASGAAGGNPQLLAASHKQAGTSSQFLQMPGGLSAATAMAGPQDPVQKLAELKNQLTLAEHTLNSYRLGTQYPHESRPAAQHADQLYPNQPVEEEHAMRKPDGKANPSIQIRTSQTRVYVASGEAVLFTVKAHDRNGKTLPLFVTRALARGLTEQGSRSAPQAMLAFGDDGSSGDSVAADGTHSGLLAPGMTSLANFHGTIRVQVNYNVGDQAGQAFFDIIYTPELPAKWSGSVREAVENGSLNLYLKADVYKAGRYIVHGRVDDASGKPFAFVHFNDVLPAGPNEIRLTVFGKLIRDQAPAFPLRLRDVDGYLLKEDTDPDRALLPRLMGSVHVTKTYAANSFSDAEWQSEERSRYLDEFNKDVQHAREALKQHNSQQTR